jgi:hypothetical protein
MGSSTLFRTGTTTSRGFAGDNLVHGGQQLALFNTHAGAY